MPEITVGQVWTDTMLDDAKVTISAIENRRVYVDLEMNRDRHIQRISMVVFLESAEHYAKEGRWLQQ